MTPAYSDIGNTGPGGGIIFYETEDGLHGLEAAPSDLDGKFPWGCIGVNLADVDDVSFDSTDSQSGEYNTPIIAEACGPDSAAGAANDFSFAGVDDWFLPNKAELDLMWRAIGSGCTFSSEAKAVSGCIDVAQLSGGWYWCSSESNSEKVWNQEMRGGGVDRSARNIKLRVRPIRAF
ncbi:MAG: DUF1566 domain-containing protein [Gammaproteobacteria bacterium]|nr:DUF1566 domain-containing protein [Gammaproteobacteria bacterium]